jgi:hypothetical protein
MISEYEEGCPCGDGKVPDQDGQCVMPEVTFMAFVMSLNTSALFHLGEIADPVNGEKLIDLPLARHAIDTLALLEDKTRGNLDNDEMEMPKNVLYDVKLKFVAVAKDEKRKAAADG